jgi:mono/diheme cytochrome c family protein
MLVLAYLAGCGERTPDMDMAMFRAHTESEAVLIQGREAYLTYCVGCHGVDGDGKGPAAEFLNPKPRDFTRGIYKFVSTAAGDLARDEDILRTLHRGLIGSSMPDWKLLDRQTQDALVAYLKSFSDFYEDGEEGEALPVPSDPWKYDEAGGIARGKTVYHGQATCYKCHPAYATHEEIQAAAVTMNSPVPERFAEDLYIEKIKYSETHDTDIRPPDFTRRQLRTGNELRDLMQVIQSGVGGTAMPTWAGVLDPGDLWAMAHYVRSLTELRNTREGVALRDSLGIR